MIFTNAYMCSCVCADAKYMAHPRAVQTFIRYFALNILSQYYSVPPQLQSTLVALTDVVIHR
jgi:hypothetical protein